MRLELQTLILDYQHRVATACQLIRERFRIEEVFPYCWREPGKSRTGWLDDAMTISYSFHGIGCRVEFDNVLVDFDFGPAFRHDGFDAWRLWLFAETVPAYQGIGNYEQLENELNELKHAGEIVQFPESSLYYFPDIAVGENAALVDAREKL